MNKLLHSRVFRFLVCFLVVCCILVNCSPINAEATTVVGSGLTLSAVLAWLMSAALGVVSVDLTVESLNRIGKDYKDSVLANSNSSVISAYENLEDNFINYLSSVEFDRNQWAEDLHTVFTSDTLKNAASWLCDVVKMGGYQVEGNAASSGWSYYGDFYAPTFPTFEEFPYMHLRAYKDTSYYLFYSDVPFFWKSGNNYAVSTSGVGNYIQFNPNSFSSWNINSSYSVHTGETYTSSWCGMPGATVWANFDIYSFSDGTTLFYAGSKPSSTKADIIETSGYVGEIPQNIIEGKENEETLTIPIVDPLTAIATPATAREDINALIAGLKNGTITLDDYLEKVRAEAITTTPDATTAPGTDSESGTTTDTWTPPADPSGFALDLSGIFPFCIPFDLYDFLCCLDAPPEAPVIEWEIALPGGGSYPLLIDLSPFDSVAQLLRRLQLLLFIVALAIKTRDLIKG